MTIDKRDKNLIEGIDNLIKVAPELGISPFGFECLKKEVERLIKERDEAREKAKNNGTYRP